MQHHLHRTLHVGPGYSCLMYQGHACAEQKHAVCIRVVRTVVMISATHQSAQLVDERPIS